jgi:hypothetical protein
VRGLSVIATLLVLVSAATSAAPLLDTTLTLGKRPDAVELPVTIPADGSYQLILTDFGTPSGPVRLARLDVGLARGSTLVTSANVTPSNTTGTTTKTFNATAGDHRLIIIGQPNPPAIVGSAGIRIEDSMGTVVADTLQSFTTAAPSTAPPYEDDVDVAAAGTYTIAITDFALPQQLDSLGTAIVRHSDNALVNLMGSGEVVVSTTGPDRFQIFTSAINATEGLLGVNLRDATTGATIYAKLHEIGDWPYKYPFDVGTATSLRVALNDLGFPAPLARLGGVLARDARLAAPALAPAPGAGVISSTPSPVSGSFTVYVSGKEAAGTNAGSFGLSVTDGGGTRLVDTVQPITPPPSATDVGAVDKSFDVADAGDYTLTLTDYGAIGFTAPFASIDLALTNDNQIVKTLSAAGHFTFTATPGHYSVAILADPQGTNGQGLLGVTVTGGPNNATVYEDTAAVGTGFLSATFDVLAAQNLDATLVDLAFPAKFGQISVAVTRGSTLAGEILGAGEFTFAATPGRYFVNLLATPDPTIGYSTLGLTVDATPTAPTVTLAASPTSVQTGSNVMLTWSSTDTKSCVASGGWSGTRAVSGAMMVGPLNAPATYTLTCTGGGGSAVGSVDVAIEAAQRSGGGGAADSGLLLVLALGLGLLRLSRPSRAAAR